MINWQDVGLGIFVWEMAIPSVPVCCGPSPMSSDNMEGGTFYHHISMERSHDREGRTIYHNDAMQMIWEYGAKRRGETEPNPHTWIEFERAEGVASFVGTYPAGGFENSLFYRKVHFSEMMARPMPDHQLKNLSKFPLRRTDFKREDCQKEMDFHLAWRETVPEFPLNEVRVDDEKERYGHDYFYKRTSRTSNAVRLCLVPLEMFII